MPPEERGQRGLSRDRLVEAALGLVQDEGLDGLSMRALAERLDVKAASIYWHVRDRSELLDLLAESILDSVPRPRTNRGWRQAVLATAGALAKHVAAQKDAPRILLETPDTLTRSRPFHDLVAQLGTAGLARGEASDVALMAMTYVITGRGPVGAVEELAQGAPAELAVDSGSRGVTIRAGSPDMDELVRVPPERSAAAPAVVRGERVVVRRLRGVGQGELELNPRHPWRVHVQAPTWKTLLDAGGLDLRQVHIDSGAARVEIFLPRPSGVVPIHISGGVVGVEIHRPRGTAVVAELSTGAVQVKLDDFSTGTTVFDTHWETPDAAAAADRFELRVSSGAWRVHLDTYELKAAVRQTGTAAPAGAGAATALDILLDGVEARI